MRFRQIDEGSIVRNLWITMFLSWLTSWLTSLKRVRCLLAICGLLLFHSCFLVYRQIAVKIRNPSSREILDGSQHAWRDSNPQPSDP